MFPGSKRWIVDRATLKKARVLDAYYAEDPEYLDFLAIFFANRALRPSIAEQVTDLVSSHLQTRSKASTKAASRRHRHHLFPSVLSQEFLLRDGPFHRYCCMLLRRSQSRGGPRTHQECGD